MKPKGELLNIAFASDRLRALGLKQWWLADQLGVDRKTVARWLSGRVKRIQPENLAGLARELACEPAALVLLDDADAFATKAERFEAARLIEQEGLIEALGPGGQWRMLETLIKATMQPDLPLPLLGQLYNQLAIAAWRQSHLERAERFAAQALALGERCGSQVVIAASKLNAATIASFRGRASQALVLYKECMALSAFLEDDLTRAKAMSNVGAVHFEMGDLASAERWQRQAIACFAQLDRPMNEAIAWIGLGEVLLERAGTEGGTDFSLAVAAFEGGERLARQGGYKRGVPDVLLFLADIESRRGLPEAARALLERSRKGHAVLGIHEGRSEEIAARVARLRGDPVVAARSIAEGLRISTDFPVARARLLEERRQLALGAGDTVGAARDLGEIRKILEDLGALPRLDALAAAVGTAALEAAALSAGGCGPP